MKKQLFLLLATIISFNGYSQISFEKGYYVNNDDQKIECLIKNIDWKNNPTNFEYKLSEDGETAFADIKSVKEFGISQYSKFIRKTVKIDKSSESIENLDYDINPTFVEEELFLKVLIEGNANLYLYESQQYKKFFYSYNDSKIEQLVYKVYTNSDYTQAKKNRLYRQQLWSNLKCSTIEQNRIEKLDYKKNDLINFFIDYNKCNNSEYKEYGGNDKKDLFNLTFRPRLNQSSLSIENSVNKVSNTEFDKQNSFGFGIEVEFILPFNKNKWSIAIEPTYQSYKSEKPTHHNYILNGKVVVNYSSIEIPFSLRHYFFLNQDSKFFVNASFVLDLASKSSVEYKNFNNSFNAQTLEIKTQFNPAFGLGYKFKNKYSLEMRYQGNRNVLSDHQKWKSNYTSTSIVFGYSIF